MHLSSGDLSGPDNDDVFYADSNEPPALRTSEKQMRANARTCYVRRGWDSVPVVVVQYRLIFFTTPKVACTGFKQLLSRMLGVNETKTSVHNPKTNKLTYLSAYPFETAYAMLRNNSWTKAIFFRSPVKRFVSGYYDKIQRTAPEIDLATFVSKVEHGWHHKLEVHWKSQCEYVHKCDAILPFINFIGDFDNLSNDTRRLLERVGAWEEYGRTGWGDDGGKCIFCRGVRAAGPPGHATNSTSRSQGILASQPDLVRRIKLLVSEDVRIIPRYIRT